MTSRSRPGRGQGAVLRHAGPGRPAAPNVLRLELRAAPSPRPASLTSAPCPRASRPTGRRGAADDFGAKRCCFAAAGPPAPAARAPHEEEVSGATAGPRRPDLPRRAWGRWWSFRPRSGLAWGSGGGGGGGGKWGDWVLTSGEVGHRVARSGDRGRDFPVMGGKRPARERDVPRGAPTLPGRKRAGDPPGQVPRPAGNRRLRDEGAGALPVRLSGGGVRGRGHAGAGGVEAGRARAPGRRARSSPARPRSSPDKQGRVAIPQPLREFAGLDRDVVVAGVFSRIEIWDASAGGSANARATRA